MFQGRVRILDAPKLPWLGQDGEITELHTAAEHGVAATTGRPPSVPKLENLPRPSFNLDMTQAEWSFKESQWKVYINQTSVSESVKVQQLKAACDEALLRRVHDAGGLTSLNSETDLLAEIRKLAVRVIHKTLHLKTCGAWSSHRRNPSGASQAAWLVQQTYVALVSHALRVDARFVVLSR